MTTVAVGPEYYEWSKGIFPEGMKVHVVPCGSAFVCDPPVLDTDEDYLVWSPKEVAKEVETCLRSAGFVDESGTDNPSGSSRPTWADGTPDYRFSSWRKGNVNLIVTFSEKFYGRHRAATHVSRVLNVLEKKKRIMVYQAVLYGNSPRENHV